MSLKFVKDKTSRGFDIIRFKDDYDTMCNIQESSSIEPHIWLGIEDPHPLILRNDGKGWVDYDMPRNVVVHHRMHLTPMQAASLGMELIKYAITGKISGEWNNEKEK